MSVSITRAMLIVAVVVTTACSDDGSTESSSTVAGGITVAAAASLTEAFTRIGVDFERAHPNVTATLNFGSSGTLATQIEQGAPADIYASADEETMSKLAAADLVDGTPVVFARNELAIVTKPGNPEQVKSLADLARLDVVSLCGDTVPCGRYAAQILLDAGVTIFETRVTRGQDVKTTLGAVTTGDADAAIVYATDAESAGDAVDVVTVPAVQNAIAIYPIAALTASDNRTTARAFIRYVRSPEGRATLRSFGFLSPA